MSDSCCQETKSCCKKTSCCIYALAIVGTFLLMAGLVKLTRRYTAPPDLGVNRAEERLKNLKEFRAENAPILERYEWQNKDRDIIRVPVDRAKELVLEEWQNPAAGRSNLLARAAKAFAPGPKPPEVKSAYE